MFFVVQALIHICIMSLFLTVMFFTVVSNEERKITSRQVKFLLEQTIIPPIDSIPDYDTRDYLINFINSKLKIVSENLKGSDVTVQMGNKNIINMILIVGGAIFGLFIFLLLIVYFVYGGWPKLLDVLIHNFFVIICVALTELFFLFFITASYISVKPNLIINTFLNKILQ